MHINEWSLRSSVLASALVLAGGFMSAAVAEEEGGAGFEEWAVGDPSTPVEDCGEACMFTTEIVEDEVLPGDEIIEDTIVLEDGIPVIDPLPIDDCGEACMSGLPVDGEVIVGEEVPVDVEGCGDCIFYTMGGEEPLPVEGDGEVVDGGEVPVDMTDGCGEACYTMVEDGMNNIRSVDDGNDLEMIPLMSASGAEAPSVIDTPIDVSGAVGIADYLDNTALDSIESNVVDTTEIAVTEGQPAEVAQMDGKTTAIRGGHLQ